MKIVINKDNSVIVQAQSVVPGTTVMIEKDLCLCITDPIPEREASLFVKFSTGETIMLGDEEQIVLASAHVVLGLAPTEDQG